LKTVVATRARYRIHIEGVGSDAIANAIEDSLKSTFAFNPARPEVPDWSIPLADVQTGASQRGRGAVDFLDVMLMADGSLQVWLNSIPPSIGAIQQERRAAGARCCPRADIAGLQPRYARNRQSEMIGRCFVACASSGTALSWRSGSSHARRS